ncbi:MAG: hypothetical protein JWO41_112 [Candidatus Saccharibacteria bacterium]|nr:hypothetical protein [Candidatus Saccharibacteria bacterium]
MIALLGSMLVSVAFFGYGAWRNHSFEYSYFLWNLFLAWIPFGLTFWLVRILKKQLWSSWPALVASFLWLVFLPNSFYMISDFIHLQNVSRVDILYDAVMFTSFIYTGVLLGMSSLYLIHLELKKRMPPRQAGYWIGLTLFICSFAIYVGRDLRWNSWDILTNPGGLLFDVSDRLLHPSAYPQMLVTILTFFALLGSMYTMFWTGAALLRSGKR